MKIKNITIFLGLFFASFNICLLKSASSTSDLEEVVDEPFEITTLPKPDWQPIPFNVARTLEFNRLFVKKRFDAFLKEVEQEFSKGTIKLITNLEQAFAHYINNEIETCIKAEDATKQEIRDFIRREAIRERLDRAGI